MTRIVLLLSFALVSAFTSLTAETIAHYKFETTETNRPLAHLQDFGPRGHHGIVLGREPFDVTSDVPPHTNVTQLALDARGRLDYAIIPHHADFAPQGDWTIEFFIKPSLLHQEHGGETNIAGIYSYLNTNLSYTVLAKANTNEPTRFGAAWAFHYQPANGFLLATISYGTNAGETLLASGDMRDGKWHHVALVFRTAIENEVSIYFDGFLTMSVNQHGGNMPIPFGTGPIFVGAFSEQDEHFAQRDRNFDGLIDEIRFSDTALNTQSFLVDLTPSPLELEIFPAVEIRFPTENRQLYQITGFPILSPGDGESLGFVLGDGGKKSFFDRTANGERRFYKVNRY